MQTGFEAVKDVVEKLVKRLEEDRETFPDRQNFIDAAVRVKPALIAGPDDLAAIMSIVAVLCAYHPPMLFMIAEGARAAHMEIMQREDENLNSKAFDELFKNAPVV